MFCICVMKDPILFHVGIQLMAKASSLNGVIVSRERAQKLGTFGVEVCANLPVIAAID